MSLRLTMEDYIVAWFAPLHFKASAAILIMGMTNVAIAFFPAGEVGISITSYMALLVGVGAGDVVVATPTHNNSSVLEYNIIKVKPEQVIPKQWQNALDRHIHSAVTVIQAAPETGARVMLFTQPRGPIIHYGCILSRNSVIKSAQIRDALAHKYNAFAIEMEAAGMMNFSSRVATSVIIVTRPWIVAWGDENGENYDKHKIWAKCTVCVAGDVVQEEREAA
ncbi:hypothetical protein BJX64DRAFT_280756 [Aspergillus heterothallicus]